MVMMRMIRGRIGNDLHSLNVLSKDFSFIPNQEQIRPTHIMLEKKRESMKQIEETWNSPLDYILSTVFHKPTVIDATNKKLAVECTNINDEVKFVRNEFPYQAVEGHHYVLWIGPNSSGNVVSEELINQLITSALRDLTNGDNFDFAWYENPKMTVPAIYHLQVFWKEIPSNLPSLSSA